MNAMLFCQLDREVQYITCRPLK